MAKKVLLADPDHEYANRMTDFLKKSGYQTVQTNDSSKILSVIRDQLPSIIVMEVVFPEQSGFGVFKSLKLDPFTTHLPVIIVTTKSEDIDKILGLELGAADYLAKPVHPRELVLRIDNILSRYREPSWDGKITLGDLLLDRDRCEAWLQGNRVQFTALEFKLLYLLAERCGRVQTRENILKDIWGYDAEINSRTLDTHIRKIRAKLGECGRYVETSYGFGYRAVEPIS
jgi:DNA-binding response OmpR family regulator